MDAGKPLIAGGIIKGQRYRWSLVKKLGEGDAGEVYRVESLLEQKPGILKRPHRSSFTTDVLRQAAQIKTEGRILRALEGIALPGGDLAVRTPALIDQSEPGSEFGDQYFVVIEEAPGMDLATMSRLARFGKAEEEQQEPRSPEEQIFIQHLIERGSIPELVLLRALLGLVTLFEKVHFTEITREGVRQAGVMRPSSDELVDLTGIKVLLVDDEADARELLTEVLEQCGATVVSALKTARSDLPSRS